MKLTNKIFGFVALIALVFSALAFASALDLPPLVSIGASPNPTEVMSTITAIATDLSGSGIAWVKIYEDGVLVKTCSTSLCVYIDTHTAPGIRSYYTIASDNKGKKTTSSTVNVNFNGAPILDPIGNKTVNESELLQFTIVGYDYNGDPLTYSAAGLPAGAVFNTLTHTFSWTPADGQDGDYSVTFTVSDGLLTDSETINITVIDFINVNVAPVLNPIGDKSVNISALLTFVISATDLNGDPLTYSTSALPAGATFNAATQTFSWIPTAGDVGAHSVTFTVSDGLLTDSETIIITVNNIVNSAPVLAPIGDQTVDEGDLLQFTISATDADGDPLTYSTSALPAGATFDALTQTFSWTPADGQDGVYSVTFTVSDGALTDFETITITVNDVVFVNNAPVLDAIGDKTVLVGDTLSFTINASDIDGDVLSYAASGVPAGASFNAGTRTFTWTPTIADLGGYSVNFSVSDALLMDSEVITITVTNVTTDTDGPDFMDEDHSVDQINGTFWFVSALELEDVLSGLDSVWIDFDGDTYSNDTFIVITDDDEIYNYTADLLAQNESFLICFTLSGENVCGFFEYNVSVGDHEYTWYANDTLGNENHEDFEFNFVNDVPVYSNLTESPASPAAYLSDGDYWLNITVTDFDEYVWARLEFDGVNFYPYDSSYIAMLNETEISDMMAYEGGILVVYPVSDTTSVYSFRTRNLPIGEFNYTWYMMDSVGNINQTDVFTYEVVQATPALSISISPGSSVSSGTTTTVSGLGCPSQLTCTLYRDGVAVGNSDVQTLADGTYTYVYNTTGNENYTAASVSSTLTLSSGSSGGGGSSNDDIHTITDEKLRTGTSVYMDIGDKLKFNFCGAPYYIKLSDIDDEDDKAYFKVTPGEDTLIIDKGDREDIDLNDDGIADVSLKVESLTSSRAKVYIKLLATNSCNSKKLTTINPIVVGSSDGVTKLNPKNASAMTIDALAMTLMIGIILSGLAILIAILLKSRRKPAVQNGMH